MKNFVKLKKCGITSLKGLIKNLYRVYYKDSLFNYKIDKRYYLDFFINSFNLNKIEFFENIKTLTNIDYKIGLNDLNIKEIKKNIKNFDVLKKYGFCPIINEFKLIAIISSNPFLIFEKFNIDENVKIYLTLGNDITEFLSLLESGENKKDGASDVFLKTLKALIIECEEKHISRLVFEYAQNKVFYSYQDKAKEWKKGNIINQDLSEFWLNLESNFFYKIKKDNFFKVRKIKLNNLGNVIMLSWAIPKKVLASTNNIALVSKDEKLREKVFNAFKNSNIFVRNYESFFDLFNDYKNYKFKVLIISLDKETLKNEEKVFKSNNKKMRSILIANENINEIEAYLYGVDYYIENDFSLEYLQDIVKNFLS
ncbi:MAG: hypothetical protein ACOX3T_02135 [Bdellovibrionota bacterium]